MNLGRIAGRSWIVLASIAIILLAGFAVYQLQGAFGSPNTGMPGNGSDQIEPFNPKRVTLEVFGDPGTTATITYANVDSRPQRIDNAPLPWSYDGSTTTPAVVLNLQAQGTAYTIGCRITVDGIVKVERSQSRPDAYVSCLDKSG